MLETLVTSLILALISSLAYLAYKHPKAYAKIYAPILVSMLCVLIALTAWDAALTFAYRPVAKLAKSTEELDTMGQALDSVKVSRSVWPVPAIWFLLQAYLYVLSRLPSILADEENDTSPKKQPTRNRQDKVK
jgi:hypothetical protein